MSEYGKFPKSVEELIRKANNMSPEAKQLSREVVRKYEELRKLPPEERKKVIKGYIEQVVNDVKDAND
jgi:adenylate kinase